MTTHILLTGAGFSRNWGGWLAKELEGDLLARLASDSELRKLVQTSTNYEEALEFARGVGFSRPGAGTEAIKRLEKAIEDSFWAMNMALAMRPNLELSAEGSPSIQGFLGRFDAIFSLNQDLLLDFHYSPKGRSPPRWEGTYFPGIVPQIMPILTSGELVSLRRTVGEIGCSMAALQPIYKLHGSVDWLDGTGSLFVVGGGKESYILSKPLLRAYFDEFQRRLLMPQTRLMVIGYGFADEHVNKLISDASQANGTLFIYYVHPEGRDAVHRGKQHQVMMGYSPPDIARVPCIGESRRPLSSTFTTDLLEYDKLVRFFA
jgi:hypothetical protein